uniref:Transmembrane protein n=1 Tax=Cucumis melo TaxID=3656 RepID=A0A9I9EA90_CUCME
MDLILDLLNYPFLVPFSMVLLFLLVLLVFVVMLTLVSVVVLSLVIASNVELLANFLDESRHVLIVDDGFGMGLRSCVCGKWGRKEGEFIDGKR